ncbi:GntR family transcriptional regulator [Halomonas borealis]|jgi:DNA-binding GntR family transcriptional regulator|uniref:GntR family transcriptional regulator n=1 Tax=Halomonas borealis TaxID=2508710 RepID=UPI0010A029E5|nr:GntR family transcriptional regulator [Halomonas borealis]
MSQRQVDAASQPASGNESSGQHGDERHAAIHRSISDAIIEHRLKPGARLREDALSEIFGISRTGIRKILQQLALEQLVTLTPRRGASVTRPTAEEARDVFAARQMVECGLMPDVARRIDAADLERLHDMERREREALEAGEQSAAIKLSAAFHGVLAKLSGNATLAAFVEQLCSRSSLILAVYGNAGHLGCETHDHESLLRHLERGDGERARDFMSRHLQAIEASLAIHEPEDEAPDLYEIFSD